MFSEPEQEVSGVPHPRCLQQRRNHRPVQFSVGPSVRQRTHTELFSSTGREGWEARMRWSGILGKTAAGLGAVAVPVVFAVAGAGQASADPGVCVGGPWGYASA